MHNAHCALTVIDLIDALVSKQGRKAALLSQIVFRIRALLLYDKREHCFRLDDGSANPNVRDDVKANAAI